MRIKSYFANSVEAAMAQARVEFGPEAMLMNSRKTLAGSRHLGEYEVVFACPNGAEPPTTPAAGEQPPAAGPQDGILKEMADLRKQMERMAAGMGRAKSLTSTSLLTDPIFATLFSSLVAADVEPGLANNLLNALRARGPIRSQEEVGKRLRQELENLACADPTAGKSGMMRVVALVGPPGAGKTTCLAKLALHVGLSSRKPTQFLSIDTERIGAADHLHTLAQILGCGFRAVESTHALAQAIEEHRNKHLILIDTPGVGARDSETFDSLAQFFTGRDDIDVHMAAPVNIKATDLSMMVDRFIELGAAKLLFTKVDETRTYGAILNESVRTGKPVSFLSTGQQIPEDLEPASKSRIADLVLGDVTSKASFAAA